MRSFAVLCAVVLVCLPLVTCAPISSTSSPFLKWYKQGPSFLHRLYQSLATNQSTLSHLGATRVHGIFASVQQPQNATASTKVVNIFSQFTSSSLSLNKTFMVNLHLTVQKGFQQGVCNLVLQDVNSNTEILSKDIPCTTQSKLLLKVTSCVKQWITNPSSNSGLSIRISSKTDGFPQSSLPYISMDPNIEPPFFIIYV